jgi:glycosyltransferase involved in cell wall biosynthesis
MDARVVRENVRTTHAGILCTGRISDAELRSLYEHATCLVYPSLYEGFGIPPLEAMACGCPVIAGNTSSIPEACGEAALLFDPISPKALVACLKALIDDDTLRDRLAVRGRVHAAARTWGMVANNLMEVIASISSTTHA